jgi:hypothetical protein
VHLELLAKQEVTVESRVVNATVRILERDRCLDAQLGRRHRVGATVEVDQRRSGLPLGDMALDHVQERADVGAAMREIDSDRKGVVLLDHLGAEGCKRLVEVVCRLGRARLNRERPHATPKDYPRLQSDRFRYVNELLSERLDVKFR